MKTDNGEINDKIISEDIEILTVGDLKAAIAAIPRDVPIGFGNNTAVRIINAPSAPCLIVFDKEFDN